jgi:copper chaperone
MTHTYKFDVVMTCGGCSGAIERVLKKLEGPSCPQQSQDV